MGVLWGGGFSDLQAAAAEEQVSTDPAAKQPRKTEAYFAPYLLGTFPVDKDISIGGNGFASETFRGTNMKGSTGDGSKAGATWAFAYQFLAGVRAYVQRNVFLFGEYRYFGSSYVWKSETSSGGRVPRPRWLSARISPPRDRCFILRSLCVRAASVPVPGRDAPPA